MLKGLRFICLYWAAGIPLLMVIPAYAGMYITNHWIPACACLQQAGRNDDGVLFLLSSIPTVR